MIAVVSQPLGPFRVSGAGCEHCGLSLGGVCTRHLRPIFTRSTHPPEQPSNGRTVPAAVPAGGAVAHPRPSTAHAALPCPATSANRRIGPPPPHRAALPTPVAGGGGGRGGGGGGGGGGDRSGVPLTGLHTAGSGGKGGGRLTPSCEMEVAHRLTLDRGTEAEGAHRGTEAQGAHSRLHTAGAGGAGHMEWKQARLVQTVVGTGGEGAVETGGCGRVGGDGGQGGGAAERCDGAAATVSLASPTHCDPSTAPPPTTGQPTGQPGALEGSDVEPALPWESRWSGEGQDEGADGAAAASHREPEEVAAARAPSRRQSQANGSKQAARPWSGCPLCSTALNRRCHRCLPVMRGGKVDALPSFLPLPPLPCPFLHPAPTQPPNQLPPTRIS